jgi:hypothetical protein
MIKFIRLWILASAACASAGWILSAFHQVNLVGYVVYLSAFGAAAWRLFLRQPAEASLPTKMASKGFRWNWPRFRRPLPFLYLITAALAAIGGTVYAPNNYDALTYRVPRMLHWWAASGWHWISTQNERMNLSGTNFEWLMMPLFMVTHSDRLFYLLNIAAYLLLPALVFLVFVGAGAPRRVAWFWMWLMPAALCYAMQAGSISNDTIAVIYFLGALYFAFQARRNGSIADLWLAFLAGGLMTGVKGSNLPLALPVILAIAPSLKLMRKRVFTTIGVLIISTVISYAPTAYLNYYYTGDWSGDPTNSEKIKIQKPLAGVLGNGLQLGLQSLEPPFLPVARSAENWVWQRFPDKLRAKLIRDFPRFVVGFRELPQEESSGVGIAITLIALISVAADWLYSRRHKSASSKIQISHGMMIGLATWAALLVYMSKLGSESTSRLIAAYYPLLLLPLLLNPAQEILVRKRWYKALAIVSGLIALFAVVLTPSRPLWPATTFFDEAVVKFPNSELLARARKVYAIYRRRSDLFTEIRDKIPQSVAVIGLIEGEDDAEAGLWRPYGDRRIVHVPNAAKVRDCKLEWIVVKNIMIGPKNSTAFNDWLRHSGGVLVAQQIITEKAGGGPEKWSVVQFPEAEN